MSSSTFGTGFFCTSSYSFSSGNEPPLHSLRIMSPAAICRHRAVTQQDQGFGKCTPTLLDTRDTPKRHDTPSSGGRRQAKKVYNTYKPTQRWPSLSSTHPQTATKTNSACKNNIQARENHLADLLDANKNRGRTIGTIRSTLADLQLPRKTTCSNA